MDARVSGVAVSVLAAPIVLHWTAPRRTGTHQLFIDGHVRITPGADWFISPVNGVLSIALWLAVGIALNAPRARGPRAQSPVRPAVCNPLTSFNVFARLCSSRSQVPRMPSVSRRPTAVRRAPLPAVPRARGERCCDPGPRPDIGARAAQALSDELALLAHPVRLQILDVLGRHAGRVCVCDVEAAVPVKQPTVSHHLRILRTAGLVRVERQGVWAYYTVDREALRGLRARVAEGLGALG